MMLKTAPPPWLRKALADAGMGIPKPLFAKKTERRSHGCTTADVFAE